MYEKKLKDVYAGVFQYLGVEEMYFTLGGLLHTLQYCMIYQNVP